MANVESAGLLLYRKRNEIIEVLLVHPGGPFFAKKDVGAWGIPKGIIDPKEDHLTAARRETWEEVGLRPEGPFRPLPPVRQKGGKTVFAWACEWDGEVPDPLPDCSFPLEWPPKSGKTTMCQEIDQAVFFDIATAREKINPAQAVWLDGLEVNPAGEPGDDHSSGED